MEMRNLVDKLNNYAYHYYVLDEPIVADKEYDKLYDQLLLLEKQSGIVLADSPTKRVGGEILPFFEEREHFSKLYSLDKAQSKEELQKFFSKTQGATYSVEYKFDGLTLQLSYDKGQFLYATTRGNGSRGEDVTAQALTIQSFPLTIDYLGRLDVVGECIMRLSVLEKYNKTAQIPLKNARNAAAGAIRNLDSKVTKQRNLDIYFYNVNYIEDGSVKSQEQALNFLREHKFRTCDYFVTTDNPQRIEQEIDKIGERRNSLDFLIDGVVIKVNDYHLREELGYTIKFPKWAIAYKFEADENSTMLKDVAWQVGRTGKLTPIAILEPCELAGATISRATLNNYGDIQKKNVKINSTVFIRRSNDVIPEVLGLAEDYENSEQIIPPTHCPACKYPLKLVGANLFCENEFCPPQIVGKLAHFCSKDAFDIDGLSEKTLQVLYKTFKITQFYQLYDLKAEDIAKLDLEGFGDKKIENIINAINSSKKGKTFADFLYAISIKNVGKKTASDIAKVYGDLEKISKATVEDLQKINDVGEIVAKSIVDYFAEIHNMANCKRLLEKISLDEMTVKKGIFEGQFAVITGTLKKYSRTEAQKLIVDNGGQTQDSVSKKTTLLVCGENAGSKLAKAKQLGIKIIDENEFDSMLKA